jgi:hydrogenase nickel incorporation protein HypA/HybF
MADPVEVFDAAEEFSFSLARLRTRLQPQGVNETMHEFSVAQSIVQTVLQVAEENGASQIVQMNLVVGEVALVNVEQLTWYIDMITKGTCAEGMHVSIARSATRIRCMSCGYEGGVAYREADSHPDLSLPVFECPDCGSAETIITAGKELHIKDVHANYDAIEHQQSEEKDEEQ